MHEEFHIFNVLSVNEELEKEFHIFFSKYGLTPLFTNENRAGEISVTDNDLRSVVNEGGQYHSLLKNFADLLNRATDNKKYEEAVFKIIYEARTFQKMMNLIKGILNGTIIVEEGYQHNIWNIVFYAKELFE